MRNASTAKGKTNYFALILLVMCMFASCAYADAYMPVYTEAPSAPVYWQMTKIELEPQIRTKGGFTAEYAAEGFALDLSDPLMAESIANAGESDPVVSLTIENSARAQRQSYEWTPLPVYMEPGQHYAIEITGESAENTEKLDSLLSVNQQGEQVLRVSAGGYNDRPASAVYDLTPLYTDEMVVSFVVRDVNDMFRLRVAYTYEMVEGMRPYPTPVPGFVATEAPVEIPSFYEPVEGKEGLWRVSTKPDEYRAYGVMSGEGPNFFPADENGNVVMNETPVTPQQDYDSFVAGFVPWTAENEPAAYTKEANGTYSFVTRDGATEYRAYGRMNGGEAAFYPSDENGAVAEDALPTTPEADFDAYQKGFGAAQPQEAPAAYAENGGVYAFTGRDGVTRYRVYGRKDGEAPAWYECDENGVVADDALPTTPEADFDAFIKGFDASEPAEVPAIYEQQENGVYAVEDRDGGKVYRVYGVKDGKAAAWYPCDENGVVADDAQPVTAEEDFAAFYEGFETARADGAPRYYFSTKFPSVFMFEDGEGVTHYRVYGSKDRGEPAWYPCDETGNVADDALPVDPASDLATIPAPKFVPAEPQEVPAYYERVAEGVYAVTDREGNRLYRVYGDYDSYLSAGNAWYPCDENGAVADGAQPVDPAQDYADYVEGFITEEPEQVPTYYERSENGVYAVEKRDGTKDYRVYGRLNGAPAAWYPADENGAVLDAQGAPIDPYDDFVAHVQGFESATPDEIPAHYTAGENGVYAYTNPDGVTEYRVFGSRDRGENVWYPADENGELLENAEPLNPEDEILTTLPLIDADPVIDATPEATEAATEAPAPQSEPTAQTAPEAVTVTAEPTETLAPQSEPTEEITEPVVTAEAEPTEAPAVTGDSVPAIATVATEPAAEPTTADATEEPVILVTDGATVTEAPVTEAPATEAPAAEPTEEAPEAEPTAEPAAEEKKQSPWWIAIVAAVVAAVGGGTAAVTKSKKKKK